MPERGFNPEARTAEAYAKILASPVKLASSSAYRRNQLVAVGFGNERIATAAMPEHEERKIQDKLKKYGDGRGISADIAAAKVAYLAKSARPEELVIGMDTLPILFDTETGENGQIFPTILFQKPETMEEAQKMMRDVFGLIVRGYKDFLDCTDPVRWPLDAFTFDEKKAWTKNLSSTKHKRHQASYLSLANHRPATVRVETGVAIRFPHEKKVDSFVTTVTLMPKALYRICKLKSEADQEKRIDELAQKVAIQMGQKSLSITGGINWAGEDIRKLLDVQEYRFIHGGEEIEKGVYYGAPEQALKEALLRRARGLPLTSYVDSIP